eukprot:678200_1
MSFTNVSEDSDLEIIPNPPETPIIDIDDLPSMHNNHNRKRVIKHEEHDKPRKKKRKLNQCNHTDIVYDANIKIKPEQGLAKACVDINSQSVQQKKPKRNHKSKTTSQRVRMEPFYASQPGLNYCGYCLNERCDEYQHRIIKNRGFGRIEPIQDEADKFMKCPSCSHVFALKAIRLFCAKASIRYQKMNDKKVNKMQKRAKKRDMITFGEIPKYNPSPTNPIDNHNHRNNETSSRSVVNYNKMYQLFEFDVKSLMTSSLPKIF